MLLPAGADDPTLLIRTPPSATPGFDRQRDAQARVRLGILQGALQAAYVEPSLARFDVALFLDRSQGAAAKAAGPTNGTKSATSKPVRRVGD
jgi:hypothetical protein